MALTTRQAYGLHGDGVMFPPLRWRQSSGSEVTEGTSKIFETDKVQLKRNCTDFVVFEVDSDGVLVGCGPTHANNEDASSGLVGRWASYAHPHTAPSVRKALRGVAKAAASNAAALKVSTDKVSSTLMSDGNEMQNKKSDEAEDRSKAVEESLLKVFEKRGLPLVFDALTSSTPLSSVSSSAFTTTSTPPPPLPLDAIFPCFCGILSSGSKAGGAFQSDDNNSGTSNLNEERCDACVCGMEALRTKVRDYAFTVLVAGHREHTRGPTAACADEASAEEHNSRVRHHNEVLGLWAKTLLTSAEDYDLFCSRHGGKKSTNTSPSTEESTNNSDFSPAVRAGLPLASFNDKYARTFIRIAMRYRYPFLDCHTFNVVGGAPPATTTAAGVGSNGTDGGGGERLTLLPSSTFFEHCALFGAPHPHSSYSSTGTAPLGQSVGGLGGASSAASKTIVAALEGITRLTRVSLLMTAPPYLLLGLPEKFQGKKGSSSSSYRSTSFSPTANGGDSVSNTALTAPHCQQKANTEEIKVNSKQGTESKTSVLDAINDELSYWLGGGGGGGSSNSRTTSSSAGGVKQNNSKEVPVTAVAVGSSDIRTASQQTTTAHSANNDAGTASWYCLAHPERTAAVTAAVGNLSNFRTFPPINLSFAPEASKDSRAIFHEGCKKIYGVGWRKSVANSVLSLSVDRSALQRLLSRPTAVDGGDGENRKRPREQQEAESEEKVKAANTASNTESTEAGDNKVHTIEKDNNKILADPTQQVYTHFLAIKCNLDFLKMSDALAEALTYFNAAPISDPKGRANAVSSSYTPPSRGEEVLPSAITIAGIKDKAAVTAQRISVRGDYTRTTSTFADSVLEKAMGNKKAVSGIGIDWSLRHAMVTKSESFTTAADLAVKMVAFRSEAIQKAAPIIAAMMKGSESSTTQSNNNTTTTVASNIEAGIGDRNHTHIDADVDDVVKSLERAMLDDPTVQLVYYDVPSSHYPITLSSSLSAEAAEDNDNDNPTTSNPPTSEPAWLLLTHPTTRAYPIALGDLKGNRFMIRAEVSGKIKEKRGDGGGGELVDVVGAPVAELQNRCALMHTLASVDSSNDVNEQGPHHTLASPPISSSSSSVVSVVAAFPNHFGAQRFGIVMGSVLSDDHTMGDTHTSPSLDDARAKGAKKEEDEKSQMTKSPPQGSSSSSSSSSLVSLFSCRSEEYLSELTKHTGIYILQGDYSRAVDSLLFYGAILGGGRDACEGRSGPRSTLIDKLQSYLLLTGNFQLIATNSRFPDPESLVEAYTRMYANESVRRLVAVAEAIKGVASNTTNTNTSAEKAEAGDPSFLLSPNEWSSMLCTPFTPSSASSAQLRYVRCHNLASTYRDASFIITRLCNAIKGARLAGGSGSSKGDFDKIEVGGGQSALPSPFIGSSEGALAFRENGHVWAGICQKAIMAIPFSLRQLWMHASQSLIFNHLLSREVAFARRNMGTVGIPLLVVESLRKALSPSLSSPPSSACRLGTTNSVVLPLLGRLAYPQRLLNENDVTTMELPMLLLEAAVSRFNASRDTCPGEDINSSSENAPFANAEANSSEISNHEEDNANAEREGNNVQVEVPSVVNAQSSDKCLGAVVIAVAPRNACEWLATVLREDVKLDPAVFFFTNLSNRVAAINGDNDGQYHHHHHRSFDMVSHIASQRAARAAQEVAGVSLLPHARTALAIATDVSVDLIESHYYRHSATAERKVEERGVTNKEKEEAEDDEEDRSVLRLSISFTLPSAAYATVFLMHLLGQIPN